MAYPPRRRRLVSLARVTKLRAGFARNTAVTPRAPLRSYHAVSASAPGRICLAGESLDWMTGGPSITAAIPQRVCVTAFRSPHTSNLALVSGPPLSRIRLVPPSSVAMSAYAGDELDHMQAAARATVPNSAALEGVVLVASADLPVGAGLSSSAALTLAVAASLATLCDGTLPGTEALCSIAHHAESTELHTGAGWMDFLACAYGGISRIQASDPPQADRIAGSLAVPVVLIDTGQRRTTTAVLAGQRERYRARTPAIRRYVTGTTELVNSMVDVLRSPTPDYREVGELLNAAHVLLRDQMSCSTPLIEACISRVLAAGAYGAKLTGSGHGGCLFAVVPDGRADWVLDSVGSLPVHATLLNPVDSTGLTCTRHVLRPVAPIGMFETPTATS